MVAGALGHRTLPVSPWVSPWDGKVQPSLLVYRKGWSPMRCQSTVPMCCWHHTVMTCWVAGEGDHANHWLNLSLLDKHLHKLLFVGKHPPCCLLQCLWDAGDHDVCFERKETFLPWIQEVGCPFLVRVHSLGFRYMPCPWEVVSGLCLMQLLKYILKPYKCYPCSKLSSICTWLRSLYVCVSNTHIMCLCVLKSWPQSFSDTWEFQYKYLASVSLLRGKIWGDSYHITSLGVLLLYFILYKLFSIILNIRKTLEKGGLAYFSANSSCVHLGTH